MIVFVFFKFAANQILVCRNFEDFSSSTQTLDSSTLWSHMDNSFFTMIEADLNGFTPNDDALNSGDLFSCVKFLTFVNSFSASAFKE